MSILEDKICPNPQVPFMWAIEKENEDIVYEYDGVNEVLFNTINKKEVAVLHLLGNGFGASINTKTGEFTFPNDKFRFVLNDVELTNMEGMDYKDIIQFKEFYTDGVEFGDATGMQHLKVNTTAYSIGWKKKMKFMDNILSLKIIFTIEVNVGAKLNFHLSFNKPFEGKMYVLAESRLNTFNENHHKTAKIALPDIVSDGKKAISFAMKLSK